jgi:threonine/homoserine/homoserine lactone efflux protein
MRDSGKLVAIRWLHTSIYILLATSVIFIVVCGVARYRSAWLSERYTRYTFRIFGALLFFGLVMLVVRR